MRYMRSFQYIFDHKDWPMQVLMVTIGLIIPVIGPIVLLGYSFELIEWLLANPDRKDYPKFEFNRFTENLKRGVWPFLTQMLVSVVISLPVSLFAAFFMFVIVAAGHAADSPALVVLAQLFMFVFSLAFGVVISVVTTPAIIHTGLTQKLDFNAMFGFVKDFVKRMWKETFIAMAFLIVAAMVLTTLGFCAFCIGMYFAAAIVYLAKDHLFYQLYAMYLQRGGGAIHRQPKAEPDESLIGDVPPPPTSGPPDDRIRPA